MNLFFFGAFFEVNKFSTDLMALIFIFLSLNLFDIFKLKV